MSSWSWRKADWAAVSDWRFRPTVMSTMLPEEMLGGSRIEGNSIWMR
jgi:hypothetical protein